MENDKVNFTFSEAAKAVGKDRTTIYRHAKDGKFSWDYDDDGNKVISKLELLRAYKKIKNPLQYATVVKDVVSVEIQQDTTTDTMGVLQKEIEYLKREVKELREDREERRDRERELRERLKIQTHLLEDKREKNDSPTEPLNLRSLSWVNAILIGCGVVITIALVFVAWVLPHLA